MTTIALGFLAVAGVAAVVDWVAVARGSKRVEYVAKPLTTLALIGMAATLEPALPQRQWLFVLALAFSLAGDIFLMLRNERFVEGLASFLLAQLAYIAGLSRGATPTLVPIVAAVALVGANAAITGRAVVRGAPQELRTSIVLYMLALSIMVLLALTRGPELATAAGLLFLVSDSLLGWERFVAPRAWMRLGVIVSYHLAQAAFVLSLV